MSLLTRVTKIAAVVNFWVCHDNERFLYLLNKICYFDEEAFKRLEITAVWLMTTVGIPQLWMGEDKILGNANRTKKVNKLDWSAVLKLYQRSLVNLYCKLIAFRKSSSAIKSDNIDFFHQDCDKHIFAYHRWFNEPDDLVVAIFNFSTNDQQAHRVIKWPENGRWQEVLSQVEIHINENELQMDLKSYESKIFVLKE